MNHSQSKENLQSIAEIANIKIEHSVKCKWCDGLMFIFERDQFGLQPATQYVCATCHSMIVVRDDENEILTGTKFSVKDFLLS